MSTSLDLKEDLISSCKGNISCYFNSKRKNITCPTGPMESSGSMEFSKFGLNLLEVCPSSFALIAMSASALI